jgi:hypothetical protein
VALRVLVVALRFGGKRAKKKRVRPATAITARSDWRSWAASASREKGTRRGEGAALRTPLRVGGIRGERTGERDMGALRVALVCVRVRAACPWTDADSRVWGALGTQGGDKYGMWSCASKSVGSRRGQTVRDERTGRGRPGRLGEMISAARAPGVRRGVGLQSGVDRGPEEQDKCRLVPGFDQGQQWEAGGEV